ncbi:BamA/TamA family outer membrane protein [Cyclobacterium marinum]|uniref:Metallophosphoesterase n=1 Tax=Cyclobacterium marinum (strain ATCC 25205 / DSM 745 / LMG 13164 / NCIMB 1802) TaxID=880070 RepID=G0J2A8_CYCMS|nr:BamA/TamA family outer membrane protein [Cyclobacterium marinum]AEL25182.1 metallophosphoesterase [Cyclobacterium marinum DSM 745]MBI0400747.1 BamA/TamA family outer membrane protein [Cyclobacterium marinum]
MNKIICLLILFLLSPHLKAQEAPSTFKLYLVGDAGEVEKGTHPVVEDIRNKLKADPNTPAHIIYLGDNIYPRGMPPIDDEGRDESEYILKTQLDLYKYLNGHIWMIPGNHDWKRGKADGWNSILRAEKYVLNNYPEDKVSWLPSSGCPGPEVVSLNEETVLLLLDSQWWLHLNDKPGMTSDCDYKSEEEILEAIRYVLEENKDKVIVVAMHHPLRSYGPHNGAYTWKDHLFPLTAVSPNLYLPLPGIGSIYPLYRTWFGNIQDLVHPKYEAMIEALDELFKSHSNLIQVAGHEHGLALTKEDKVNYIISGAGAKHTTIKKNNTADFTYPSQGYAIMDFKENHEVHLSFYDPLKEASIYDTQLVAPYATNDSALSFFERDFPKQVTRPISTQYLHGSGYYRFLGENYRKTWAIPATFETIDLATEKGGLSIVKKGGGMQTRSLRLESKSGREYVLRSVNKYPENALSAPLRETIAKDVIQDQISSSHPYGALAVARLADQVGVVHTNPKIVYLPDDPILGIYREAYGDNLYLFEEREIAWKTAPDDIKFYSTDKMLRKIHGDNDEQVKQKEVLKARIFDLWIGDWDRHDDQWRWIGEKKEKGRDYSPMPRDRDQAFFVNEGLIPKIGSRKWLIPKFQGFDYNAPRTVEGFMFNGRYFDRSFMNELNKEDWEKTLDEMIAKMTDEAINASLQDWPDSVVAIDGEDILGKLRKRKTWLKQEMIKYYHFLAKEVDVAGTDKNEFFKVDYLSDGRVQLSLRKIDKSGNLEQELYRRVFLPGDTKEIRLYGMEGDDIFEFTGEGTGEIKIRVIPGDGEKIVQDKGKTKKKNTLIYHNFSDNDAFKLGESTRRKAKSAEISYNRTEFKYDKLMPLATFAYNRDDGIYLGAGVMWEKQGFKKDPFAIRQSLMAKYALKTNAFNIEYEGHAVDALGNLDLVWEADVRAPQYSFNYFGVGNESEYNHESRDIAYYRARFNWYELNAGLQSKLGESGSLTFGPQFQAFKFNQDDNSNKFITSQESGLDQNDLDQTKLYTGVSAKIVFDTRDQKHMPTRGVYFEGQSERMWGGNEYSNNFSKVNAELAMYWSFRYPSRLVWATKFGAGKNWGDYEFFQAQTLGGINNLRGFRRFRFNGDAVAYNNTEVRVRLFNLKTYVFPATVGLLAFNDIGRVWERNEDSNKWHNATGAGIWLAPLNQLVATFSVGFNDEETLPFFSFGYQF